MEDAPQLAVASQLDKDALGERDADEVERLCDLVGGHQRVVWAAGEGEARARAMGRRGWRRPHHCCRQTGLYCCLLDC